MAEVRNTQLNKEKNIIQKTFSSFFIISLIFTVIQTNKALADSNSIHPLLGKLWSTKENAFVDVETLRQKVLNSDHVIIGETHDNVDHHKIQAKVLSWYIDAKRKVNPVFEMLSPEQVNSIQKSNLTTSDNFFDKASWEESGWPDRKLYKPIFDIVIQHDLPLYPAETGREVLMKLMKNGENGLPVDIKQYLSAITLNQASRNQLKNEIVASHCGMLPEKLVTPMILGQRVRDAVMAKSLIEANKKGPTLLIAGSGHGRKDHGVPAYILGVNPDSTITSIAMMEVVDDVQSASEYKDAWESDEIPFDYVWFTHRMDRPDPCEELKQHFKHKPA